MGLDNLREAEGFLQKAIERDPSYALAYAGLGQTYAMRFIGTTDPRDLRTAIQHLDKAVTLDNDLAEPYVWLAYSHIRLHENEEALRAGERAAALDPENPNAWYMLGLVCLLAAFDAPDTGLAARAETAFRRTLALSPRYTFTHGNMAGLFLGQGRVDEARSILEEAAKIEESGEYELARFVGSQALLAMVELRAGDLEAAMRWTDRALSVLEGVEHVYRHQLRAVALACRGEAAVRRQRLDDALADFRETLSECDAHQRFLGMGRVRARALLGHARALHRLGMRREAQTAAREARKFLADPTGWDMNWIWGNGDPELHEYLAGTLALVGELEAAWTSLQHAFARGWSDPTWLEQDPTLSTLRSDPRFPGFLGRVRARAEAIRA
jgi:tetratricopeptide (TPR) repeat protein